MGIGADTISASNAFRVVRGAEYSNIHFAHLAASSAGSTFPLVYLKVVDRNFIKHCIECPQRANPFAEWPVEKDSQYDYAQQNAAFPCEQPSEACTNGFVSQG